jgi:hypothetical protein
LSDANANEETKMTTSETVWVVRDASGEYVGQSGRTPASDEAREFETEAGAEAACERATDRVFSREVE